MNRAISKRHLRILNHIICDTIQNILFSHTHTKTECGTTMQVNENNDEIHNPILLHRMLSLLDAKDLNEKSTVFSWIMDLQYESLKALERDRWMLQTALQSPVSSWNKRLKGSPVPYEALALLHILILNRKVEKQTLTLRALTLQDKSIVHAQLLTYAKYFEQRYMRKVCNQMHAKDYFSYY